MPVISFIFKALVLILAQVVIFNNRVLLNVAVPFVFIYIIMAMPVTWSTNASVAAGFLTGLAIDICSDTPGVNALACTVLAFARKPIFHLYVQRDEDLTGLPPSVRTLGVPVFMKYALTMTLAYCIMVFTIDAFAIFSFLRMVSQIVCSTAFTFVIIYALDAIFSSKRK